MLHAKDMQLLLHHSLILLKDLTESAQTLTIGYTISTLQAPP
jgi:hypothetical protein